MRPTRPPGCPLQSSAVTEPEALCVLPARPCGEARGGPHLPWAWFVLSWTHSALHNSYRVPAALPAYADLLPEGPRGLRGRPRQADRSLGLCAGRTHEAGHGELEACVLAPRPRSVTQSRAGPWASVPVPAGHSVSAALSLECSRVMSPALCPQPAAHLPSPAAPLRPDASSLSDPAETPARPTPQLRLARGETLRVPSDRPFPSPRAVPKARFARVAYSLRPLPTPSAARLPLCGVHALWTHASGCGAGPWPASPAHAPDTHAAHPETEQAVSGYSTPGALRGCWGPPLAPCSGPLNRSGGKPRCLAVLAIL